MNKQDYVNELRLKIVESLQRAYDRAVERNEQREFLEVASLAGGLLSDASGDRPPMGFHVQPHEEVEE